MFVENGKFDHQALYDVTKRVTRNLNKVIDRNYYPVKQRILTCVTDQLGVQGLADAFIMLRLPLQVTKLKAESRNFETLYFAAVTASMELAKLEGLNI
jgi:ribonucleoside-diphosphate reductase alpha chain